MPPPSIPSGGLLSQEAIDIYKDFSPPTPAESAVDANRMGVEDADAAAALGDPPPSPVPTNFEDPRINEALNRAMETGERMSLETGNYVPFLGGFIDGFKLMRR